LSEILITDDEKDIRELISEILKDEGYSTRLAANSQECMAALNAEPPALMILDIWLKDSLMDGIDILKRVKRDNPDVPVVIISGHGNIEIAVAAIKQGAYDFIEKPFNIDQLLVVIGRAMEASKLRRENTELRRRDVTASDMIGASPAFRLFKSHLDKVVKSNARVMLTGEPGSGKEVAARFIHAQSPRAGGRFVSVNCAMIEPERMEEVLFGRESTARGIEPGLLEQAHEGVIYFDEVADMPPGTQSKILRVLTEQQFQRVGGSDAVRVDLRVISSTTRDLSAEMAAGRFRQELFHRLSVVPVAVPALAERREDIPELARHFIGLFAKAQNIAPRELTAEAATVLKTMNWPGNVRQLRNMVERILILGDGTGPIGPRDIPQAAAEPEARPTRMVTPELAAMPLREARDIWEREYLTIQIGRFGGNISRASSYVGLERSALHRKLKSLGLTQMLRGRAREGGFDDTEEDESAA
jgi:two-component system nitrogen regulation response regulator NtrX